MGLKHNNCNVEIVLTRKPNLVQQYFLKIMNIAFKNESCKGFFLKDAQTT